MVNGRTHNFLDHFVGEVCPEERLSLEDLTKDVFSKAFEYVNQGSVDRPVRNPLHEHENVPYSTMYQYIWRLDTPLSHKRFIDNTIIYEERDTETVCVKLRQAFSQYDMVPMGFHEITESRPYKGTFFATCKNNSGGVSEASISIWDQNLVSTLRITKTGESRKYYQLFAPYAVGPFGQKLFHELLLYIHNLCFKTGIHYLYINLDENSPLRHFFPLQKGFQVNQFLELVQPLTKEAQKYLTGLLINKKRKFLLTLVTTRQ